VEGWRYSSNVEGELFRNSLGLLKCGGCVCATSSFCGEMWRGGGQKILVKNGPKSILNAKPPEYSENRIPWS
jgi:hypothetical protein